MAIASRGFRELRLQRVSRDFGMNNALKDMRLTVKRGEFIALLDPSVRAKVTLPAITPRSMALPPVVGQRHSPVVKKHKIRSDAGRYGR
jgi:ABC-type phosphate/phosphonate transport system ATPase subunit